MKKIALCIFNVILLFSCSKPNEDTDNEIVESIVVEIQTQSTNLYNGVEATFTATVSHSVSELTFYLDGQSIGSFVSTPYVLKYTPEDIIPGTHKLLCIAKSSKGNSFNSELNLTAILRLGDSFQGGKIYFLDATGNHGYVASTTDLTYSSNGGDVVRFIWGYQERLGTTIDDGKTNTALMAAKATSSSFAGYHFKSPGYNYNGYSDWYIPSNNELEVLKENKSYVGGFSTATDWHSMYWSSSEISQTNASLINFNALMGNSYDKVTSWKIRPIRKF